MTSHRRRLLVLLTPAHHAVQQRTGRTAERVHSVAEAQQPAVGGGRVGAQQEQRERAGLEQLLEPLVPRRRGRAAEVQSGAVRGSEQVSARRKRGRRTSRAAGERTR
jgi:hypothetical protein